jgi:hypothetical protein
MKLVLASILVTVLPFAIAAADNDRPPPPRHPHPPPQVAIDACAQSKVGDTCSFTHRDHNISGTCGVIPDTTTLVCHPDHPPPPPPPRD